MDPSWHVAAGEESSELHRVSKELELVCPHSSSVHSRLRFCSLFSEVCVCGIFTGPQFWIIPLSFFRIPKISLLSFLYCSPPTSTEACAELYDDSLTPIIPIIPIEETKSFDPQPHLELPAFALESHRISEPESSAPVPPPGKVYPLAPAVLASAGPDVAAAAASAASTILLQSVEQGNMIDMNLLIKFLSDPNMVGKLIASSVGDSSMPKSNSTIPLAVPDVMATKVDPPQAAVIPSSGSDLMKSSSKVMVPIPVPTPASYETPASETAAITLPGTNLATVKLVTAPIPTPVSSGEAVRQPLAIPVSFNKAVEQPQRPMKGIDYYKNLIKQHGGEAQQNMGQIHRKYNHLENTIPDHQKPKPREKKKRCMFYNSPKGCRNGSNCPFQHGSIQSQWMAGHLADEPSAKRIRLGGEIMGR